MSQQHEVLGTVRVDRVLNCVVVVVVLVVVVVGSVIVSVGVLTRAGGRRLYGAVGVL